MKITVIGSGNMGSALIRHLAINHSVVICDRNIEKGKELAKETRSIFFETPQQAVLGAEWIILAVKPKDLVALAGTLLGVLTSEQRIISILAGTTISSLHHLFPTIPVVRVMPNLAITVKQGILGLSAENISDKERNELEDLFSPLGLLLWIPESKMEAFAALAASSPAFVFVLIEAMIEAGIHSGFSSVESKKIILKVLEGSASLLRESGASPEELKWQITSPGGTTIEGLKELEANSFRIAIWKAIAAAHQKGTQMGKE